MRQLWHGDRIVARVAGVDHRGRREAAVVEVLEEALYSGHKVVLTGFGTFQVKRAKARTVRPIRGGDPVDVPPHDRVGFVPGASLRSAIGRKK